MRLQLTEIAKLKKERSQFATRIKTLETVVAVACAEVRRVSGKVVVVGCSGIGKTSLVNRFVSDDFCPLSTTLVCDSRQKMVRIDDALVSLLLYDTAGQERFADLTAQYYRLGDACIICVDLSRTNCIQCGRVDWWRDQVRSKNDRCAIVLVGTKSDLASDDEIHNAAYYANSMNMPFFCTSAKAGLLGSLFYHVAECVLRRRTETQLSEEQFLITPTKARYESCCA